MNQQHHSTSPHDQPPQGPLALLEALIRTDPEAWLPLGDDAMSPELVEELTERAISRGRRRLRSASRRHRRNLMVGVAALVLAGGGTAAAVAWFAQPDAPEAGIVCRSAAELDASARVAEPGKDPVDTCRAVWNSGEMAQFSPNGLAGRPLTACIGPNGAIEVFPGGEAVCGDLGLPRAETELSPEVAVIVQLQDQIVTEINLVDCVGVADARSIAERLLNDLDLSGWSVKVNASDPNAPCAKAAVMTAERQVVINEV